jgi:hypothetical protein
MSTSGALKAEESGPGSARLLRMQALPTRAHDTHA